MCWKIKAIIALLFLSSCDLDNAGKVNEKEKDESISLYESVIEAIDLQKILDNESIKIIHLGAYEAFEKGHIPRALSVSRIQIEDTSYAYGGIMASTKQIETLFSNLGINNTDTLILYDDMGSCDAARLWWILQNYNFTNVKILNGGLSAWKAINGNISLTKKEINGSAFRLTATPSMKYYASINDVHEAINHNILIIDTRSSDEFSGKMKKRGASRAGQIPTSKHIDWASGFNFDRDKKFKPIEELESTYSELLSNKEDTIIVYCHSGVRSAHTTFILTQLLGYKNVKNYDGSWIEWSFHDQPQ